MASINAKKLEKWLRAFRKEHGRDPNFKDLQKFLKGGR